MKKFVASILSEGNHLFQASITILDNGVKVRIPGFWKNNETLLPGQLSNDIVNEEVKRLVYMD